MTPELLAEISHVLDAEVISHRAVGGGSINHAYRLDLPNGSVFVKTNSALAYPGMFAAESEGLALLRAAGTIGVPNSIHVGEAGPDAFLIMDWLEAGERPHDYWETFGKELAELHRVSSESFGLDHDNYIGSLHQSNSIRDSWPEFFAECRLQAQARLAFDDGQLNSEDLRRLDSICNDLGNLFPDEAPALLHGDLWSGNFMTGGDGRAWIIDPAVYYGHREMDIAMSRLFGGFDQAFYNAYRSVAPLEKGWDHRIDLCNLYPLLVHVNLFGGSYTSQVRNIISLFS